MNAWLIVLIIFASVLVLAALFALIFWLRLPYLFADKLKNKFADDGTDRNPQNFEDYKNKTVLQKDLIYRTDYCDNGFDLYLPAEKIANQKFPVLFWVHGGGFVSGDKIGVENLMTMLCSRGYAVMSINYSVAPKYKYPTAINQIHDALSYLKTDVANQHPCIDTAKLFMGGDSAGGQLVAQYTAIATNSALATEMKISPNIDKAQLKGVVLVSAPLDIATMLPPKNKQLKLLNRVFLSGYFGSFNLNKKKLLRQTDVISSVTKDFPPAFITDGNTVSFEKQNRLMAEALKNKGVYVEQLFYDLQADGVVNHEYIFDMRERRSIEAYLKIVNFLDKHK